MRALWILALSFCINSGMIAQQLTSDNIKRQFSSMSGEHSQDPDRPGYHLTPPSGCMGDPNGGIYYQGAYHIFYGLQPFRGSYGGWFWAHASSTDLLHWTHESPEVTPAFDLGLDHIGSGSTIVDQSGSPLAFYSVGMDGEMKFWRAEFDQDLTSWSHPGKNPVLTLDHPGLPPFDGFWRDPFVFRVEDRTFMIACADLLEEDYVPVPIFEAMNDDLTEWQYKDLLFTYPKHKLRNLEVPELRPIGDKWILMASSDAPKDRVYYFLGELNLETLKFIPEREGILDYSDHYYAQETILDDKGDLYVMAWIPGWDRPFLPYFTDDDVKLEDRSWNGSFAIPRKIRLDDSGKLISTPVESIVQLRGKETTIPSFDLPVDGSVTAFHVLDEIQGNQLEMQVTMDLHTSSFCGINLLADSTGDAGLAIVWSGNALNVDGVEIPMDEYTKGDFLALQVFVDKQIVEVFVNGGESSASRLVKKKNVKGDFIAMTSLGGRAKFRDIKIWKMGSIKQP